MTLSRLYACVILLTVSDTDIPDLRWGSGSRYQFMVIGSSLSPARFGRRAGFFYAFFYAIPACIYTFLLPFCREYYTFSPIFIRFFMRNRTSCGPFPVHRSGPWKLVMTTIRETTVLRIVASHSRTRLCRICIFLWFIPQIPCFACIQP